MDFGIKVAAGDVTVGMELAAGDGYLFTVKAVERQGRMVTLTLASAFSPVPAIRAGVPKRCRASTVFVRARTEAELEALRAENGGSL